MAAVGAVFVWQLACSADKAKILPGMSDGHRPAAAAVSDAAGVPIKLDWQALTMGPNCADFRDTLTALHQTYPSVRIHVLGTWMLCAIRMGDWRTVRTVADDLLQTAGLFDEWRTIALWGHWLADTSAPFPAELAELGRAVVEPAVADAARNDDDLGAKLFAAFPDWQVWQESDIRRWAPQLPAELRIATAKHLIARARPHFAWLVLEPLWQARDVAEPGANVPAWWPDATIDDRQWFADLAFTLRRYDTAAAAAEHAYTANRKAGHALLVWGRSLARLGRGSQAIAIWLKERAQVANTIAWLRITYRLGLLAEDAGRHAEAQAYYAAAAAVRLSHEDRDEAGFRSGWLAYLQGNRAQATKAWLAALERGPEIVAERRLLYWLLQTDAKQATEWQRRIFEQAPLSYYAWLAAGRDIQGVTAPIRWLDSVGETEADSGLQTIELLAALGFDAPARIELNHLLPSLQDPTQRLLALAQGEILGMANETMRQYWRYFESDFQVRTTTLNATHWRIVYPRPFQDLVRQAAMANGIEPALIYAIMREESTFDPAARSPVGALGLMQLMPATAAKAARDYKLPYSDEAALLQPQVNIPIAVAYLRELLDRYGGNPTYAMAAYNAGPGAVDRWRAKADLPLDAFVEEIPYTETRRYVVKVTRSYVRYLALYGNGL